MFKGWRIKLCSGGINPIVVLPFVVGGDVGARREAIEGPASQGIVLLLEIFRFRSS